MIPTAISSLMLLSAGLVSTPVYISDVKAVREAGHLRVEVSGDGGIDPDGASTVLEDGQLLIYLAGTRVHADNRSWTLEEGEGEIRAHRHKSQIELVVPLAGNGCSGPVELTGTDTGITAMVGCDGTVSVPARVIPARHVFKTAEKSIVNEEKLKKIIELPAAPPAAPAAAAATRAVENPAAALVPTSGAVEGTLAKTAAAVVVANPTPTAISLKPNAVAKAGSKPVAPPLMRVEAASPASSALALAPTPTPAAQAQPIPASTSGGAGLRAVALPALLLAGLAAVAYWVSRRRRGTLQRHIQILETTSLGPKRSLICARIGDETVILSSSEAGITLLRGTATPTGESAALHTMPAVTPSVSTIAAPSKSAEQSIEEAAIEIEQPLEEALADIPEPTGRVEVPVRASFRAIEGGLAGLFGKREGGFVRDESQDRFADLLEDSVEDQELRQKLAAGMSARVR